jgi:hypothetical protein
MSVAAESAVAATIGAIEHESDLRRFTRRQFPAIIGWDNQSGARLPAIDQRLHLRHRIDLEIEVKIIGRPISVDEFARRRGVILIENDNGDVTHIVRRGVAQQEQHEDGHDEHDPQRAEIADNLDELFADERQQTRVEHVSTFCMSRV